MHRKYALVFLSVLLYFSAIKAQDSGYEISKQMLSTCHKINSLYFEMTKTERIDDEYITESYATKLQYNPFRVYSKKIETEKSPELLYRQGWNDNKAFVNPDGFPWFNLSLDPRGEIMRRNQHHTLYETGYKYALAIVEFLFDKYGDEVETMASLKAPAMVNNRKCHVIEFNNHHFQYIPYQVKKGETLLDIATKLWISEYMILQINEDVDDYEDIEEGQIIKIPNDYAPKMIIAIDQERLVPISIQVFDDKSLYERLEYNNVKLNPVFKEEEFTEIYPGYGF
jgi:outer membrane lipoprotein-sorting protein